MYDETISHEANQEAATRRLQALLLDFMRREGISDLGISSCACLVDLHGRPVDEASTTVHVMMWHGLGENWGPPPGEIIAFERGAPK